MKHETRFAMILAVVLGSAGCQGVIAEEQEREESAAQALGTAGRLWTSGSAGGTSPSDLKIAAGTSPSIATLSDGSYVMALQADTSELWIAGQGIVNTHMGMMAGTSPSIAATSGGGWVAAFQANTGQLYVVSSSGAAINTQQGMASGTSPSIAVLGNNSWAAAFQANTTGLYVYTSAGVSTNTQLGMMPGTSPSIAAAGAGYAVAIESNTASMWLYTSANGAVNTGLGMMSGTSPSITALGNGYKVAFEANTAELYVYSWPGGVATNTLQGMLNPASPAITGLNSGSYAVAFEANTGQLYVYTPSTGVSTSTGQALKPGTRPSITKLAGSDYEVALHGSSVADKYWYTPDASGNTLTATNTAVGAGETFVTSTPGAGYLANHLLYQVVPPTVGDYCYTYGSTNAPPLNTPISADLSPYTGYAAPAPRESYQRGTAAGQPVANCQMSNWNAATGQWEIGFGAYISQASPLFGIHHNVHMEGDLRPWSTGVFGASPVFTMSTYDKVKVINPAGNYGYMCAWINDPSTGQSMEYCATKWRNNAQNCAPGDAGVSCFADANLPGAPAELAAAWDAGCNFSVQTVIGPGTHLSTWMPGSATTTVTKTADGVRNLYGFQINRANLANAIAWANAYLDARGWAGNHVCAWGGKKWQHFASSPAAIDNYTISLVENGAEGNPGLGFSSDTAKAWSSF